MSVRISLLVILGFLATGVVCQETPQLVMLLADGGTTNGNGSIHKIHIHHMNLTTLNISNVILPVAIDYDKQDKHIYWTDIGTKQVRRANIDGENDTVIANLNSTSSPEGLTLDSNTRQVFFTDRGNDKIVKIEMNTFQSTVLVDTGLDIPRGIIADTRNKILYWVDLGADEKIETCNYNGSQRRALVSSGLYYPNGITLDEQGGRLYWTDGIGILESILVNGTDRKRVLTYPGIRLLDISVFNGFLYFTRLSNRYIFTLSENGTQVSRLTSRLLMNPLGIHVFSPNINKTVSCPDGRHGMKCEKCGKCESGSPCEKTTGVCFRACEAGYKGQMCTEMCDGGTYGKDCASTCSDYCKSGSVCEHVTGHCPDGCKAGWMGDNCTIYSPQLVILLADNDWTNGNGSIQKIHIHHMNLTILNISNVIRPVAIDYDKQDNHIYWTDIGTKQVRRADIDGENDTVVANLSSVSSPEGLTLDSNTRQVFYTDLGTKTITKIDMTNLNTTVIISTGLDKPRGIIADTRNRKLYWVDQGNNAKIETCNYDGEQRRTLVSSRLIKPNGITLDEQTGRLFWTDGVGRIESIFVNGTGREISLKTATGTGLHDIASFNGFLYFTISRNPHIFTLSEVLNQTHLSYLRSRLFNDPTGIHIFSPNIDISVPCPYGQYGLACTKCGACSGDSPCEKITGICLSGCSAGYKGDKCTEVCDGGTYGKDCASTCSDYCKPGSVCDHVTGHCLDGCKAGWMGDNCTIYSPQLVILLADNGLTNGNGSIKKIHIHHMNLTILNISNVIRPVAIDYDKQDNHIYWTDIGTKQVRRADIDGENDTVVANLSSVSSPEGLTLDSNTRQVFYTDLGTMTITKIDMTNLNTTVIISTGLDKPRGIIAHTRNRKLYWVDQGNNAKIETCNYDGEQRRTLVSSRLIKPNGITLDEQTGRLFWTDGVGRIESIFVNGTGREISLKTATGIGLHDIAFFNGFLYFTISGNPHIFTLSEVLNQTHLSYLRSRLFNDPTGIHIFSPNIDISVPCPYGKYGLACTKCGACSGDGPCEKITGICLSGCSAGYKGDKCTEVCHRGTFGDNCESTCSTHCKTRNVCDRMTGHCSGGCASGWMGNNCTIKCGRCAGGGAGGGPCDILSGDCVLGCRRGWTGSKCESRKTITQGNGGVADAQTTGRTGSSVGMIVGIVVGVIVLLAVIVTVAVFFIRKYRGKSEPYVHFENDMENSGSVSVESPNTTNAYNLQQDQQDSQGETSS